MNDDFASTFNRLLGESGKSLSRVARTSGIDRSYLLRLSRGEKVNPSTMVIAWIFIALVADDELLERKPDLIFGIYELTTAAALTAAALAATE